VSDNSRIFGRTAAGEDVTAITLNKGFLSCEILTYGAVLRTLVVPDREGKPVDVVLGYDSVKDYETQDGYIGACVGRFANRIAGSRFGLNGREYLLEANDGRNHLHSGSSGFSYRVWNVEEVSESTVRLSVVSEDGDGGYPGRMNVSLTYELSDDGLSMRYEAEADADTICSLTNHSYFNMAGHGAGDIYRQEIMLHAEKYTPSDEESIPTGEILAVKDTPMDLRNFTEVGANINSDFIQIQQGHGYDHNFVIDGKMGQLRPAAALRCKTSGIEMRLETTLPGLQFYSGNFLGEGRVGKSGSIYRKGSGLCLETQFYPDAPNKPEFPSAVLKVGDKYEHITKLSFAIIP